MPFAVASYNVLADAYINPRWYEGVADFVLDPAWRHPALLEHISRLGADVLCLQEVEWDLFQALEARLGLLGYRGHYAQKGRGKPDGCATFVRAGAFPRQDAHTVHYADGAGSAGDSGHIALVVLLEDAGRPLAVVNTHLRWDSPGTPVAERWGYRQVSQLLAERTTLAPGGAAWIIAGDFNVTPGSEVVRLLEAAGFSDAHLGPADRPTCNANRRARRIDFLMHSRELVSHPADIPVIDDHTPLPSTEQPSDHLAILARFDWADAPP
jgi:mRNA deadenylase 3'-5' endonuclease subunit Ccr4